MDENEIIAATESESESDDQPRRFQLFLLPKRPPEHQSHHACNNNRSTDDLSHGNTELKISSDRRTAGVTAFAGGAPAVSNFRPAHGPASAPLMQSSGSMPRIKQEERELLLVDEEEEDDDISESSEDSSDGIDDDDLLLDEEDLKENRLDNAAIPSSAAGLRSLLPSPSNLPPQPFLQAPRRPDEAQWWLLLPDFVPVRELARGIDPRNGSKVHVIYEKQFTSESGSAHLKDKDKNLGVGSGGVLYDDLVGQDEGAKKVRKKRKSSEGTGSGSGGSWYYSDGKKVFRDGNGNELSGRAAWTAYKGGGKAKKKRRFKKK